MKSTSLLVLFTLSALALSGCDEVEEMRGVGAQKGVNAGGERAPLDEETRRALSKRTTQQGFGL